jgi:hypothetical protein
LGRFVASDHAEEVVAEQTEKRHDERADAEAPARELVVAEHKAPP